MSLEKYCSYPKVEILLKDLSQSQSKDTTYPKLRMAVETGQKEFVGHMYSQQVGPSLDA